MESNAVLFIHTNGKDYTYDLEDKNSFYEMKKTKWYKAVPGYEEPVDDDGFIDRFITNFTSRRSGGFIFADRKDKFRVNWTNLPDKCGKEHFNYINIVISDSEDTSIKVRLYGKEYSPDFCKSEIYESLCNDNYEIEDVETHTLIKKHVLEVYDTVKLDVFNTRIFSGLKQQYGKYCDIKGMTNKMELTISLI